VERLHFSIILDFIWTLHLKNILDCDLTWTEFFKKQDLIWIPKYDSLMAAPPPPSTKECCLRDAMERADLAKCSRALETTCHIPYTHTGLGFA